MKNRMDIHEITELFEPMTDEEFKALKQDIKTNGLIEPITRYKGEIIDGRNRYRACIELFIEPRYQEWDGEGSLISFIVSKNLHRRHLTSSQKAVLAHKLIKLGEINTTSDTKPSRLQLVTGSKGTGQKVDSKDRNAGKTAAIAASFTGTNRQSVYDIIFTDRKAPELIPEVSKGLLRTKHARRLAQETREVRESVLQKLKTGKAKDYKSALRLARVEELAREAKTLPEPSSFPRLFNKAIEDITSADIPDESISHIVTDPPYAKEYLYVYEHLARLAARVLKPGGNLLVMCGHGYLPDVFAAMSKVQGLKYRWTSKYEVPGAPTRVRYFDVRSSWKPVIWYVKGDFKDNSWPIDSYTSEKPQKNFHRWGQSESGMKSIIKTHCRVGSVIYDPFLGGGSTAIAALDLDMEFVGSDIAASCVRKTRDRILLHLNEKGNADIGLAA